MDLASYLHDKKIIVENMLRDICTSFTSTPGVLRNAMEYMLFSNGKKIRPILAIAACEAKGKSADDFLACFCTLEMIHTYSLIHDDLPCVDNDDTRRGRPTCHKAFGEAVAIMAGDGLLTEAFRVLSDPRFSERVAPKIARQFVFEIAHAAGAEGMVGGQVMDILYENKEGTKNILHYIHSHKTAAMLRASVRVGGIAGGAKARELKNFSRYGDAIGLAFQIMDDILDVEGDEETVGKKLKKDDNKQTYVKHYGILASKYKLEQLVDEAVKSVAFLGENGRVLEDIARFVGNRIS
ncbi:MAG: polyprenyl synthetase family protein [Syntrophorhabdaceae bacterium]|nr:polyprenyl synthetase family protein [Syntrophorhabdaceae bacterium]